MSSVRTGIIAGACAACGLFLLAAPASAQAVGFQAIPGFIPSGPTLNVTPSVSFDRRYVRIGVNAQFIGNVNFTTLQVPAAVGGGPGGPGALRGIGGLGGLGGGGGGAAGGGAGVGGGGAVAGGQFMAGVNGVMDPRQAQMAFFGRPEPSSPPIAIDNLRPARPRPVAIADPPKAKAGRAAPAPKVLKPAQNAGDKTAHPATAALKP
jgi:hypothetical protein